MLDQQYNRYRLAEGQLLRSQQNVTSKIPEIEKTIQMVKALRSNPGIPQLKQQWMSTFW